MKSIFLGIALVFVFSAKSQTYTQSTILSGLTYPVAFDVASDGRFFITQKGGNSSGSCANGVIKVYDAAGSYIGVFYDLTDSVQCDFERGLLGITLDPGFDTNHYVYVYYNHNSLPTGTGDERIRIVRFTESSNVGTNPFLVFDLDVADNIAGNHVGGNLHIRPSDPNHIFFTIGDLAYQQTNPTLNYANKLSNPYGKLLRIGKDGSVPTDNPYYDDGNPLTNNCDWIWTYGHRNPFDFCFSPVNDSIYVSENGLNAWDEANFIVKGGNYGWASCEGFYANSSTTVLCSTPGVIDPIVTWGTPLPAVTGIIYYSGSVWSALDNHLIVADNDYGRIYDCTLGNPPLYDTVLSKVQMGDLTTTGGLTTLKQSSDGCIFAMKGGYTTNGAIYKVCPLGIGINGVHTSTNFSSVFPNPNEGTFTLSISNKQNAKLSLELVDFTGRRLMKETISILSNDEEVKIDLLTLGIKNGVYMLFVKDSNGNAAWHKVNVNLLGN